VEKVGVQGIIENVFHLMIYVMATFGGFNVEQLGMKLISIGYDGNICFKVQKLG
jgi:hypothetical protein